MRWLTVRLAEHAGVSAPATAQECKAYTRIDFRQWHVFKVIVYLTRDEKIGLDEDDEEGNGFEKTIEFKRYNALTGDLRTYASWMRWLLKAFNALTFFAPYEVTGPEQVTGYKVEHANSQHQAFDFTRVLDISGLVNTVVNPAWAVVDKTPPPLLVEVQKVSTGGEEDIKQIQIGEEEDEENKNAALFLNAALEEQFGNLDEDNDEEESMCKLLQGNSCFDFMNFFDDFPVDNDHNVAAGAAAADTPSTTTAWIEPQHLHHHHHYYDNDTTTTTTITASGSHMQYVDQGHMNSAPICMEMHTDYTQTPPVDEEHEPFDPEVSLLRAIVDVQTQPQSAMEKFGRFDPEAAANNVVIVKPLMGEENTLCFMIPSVMINGHYWQYFQNVAVQPSMPLYLYAVCDKTVISTLVRGGSNGQVHVKTGRRIKLYCRNACLTLLVPTTTCVSSMLTVWPGEEQTLTSQFRCPYSEDETKVSLSLNLLLECNRFLLAVNHALGTKVHSSRLDHGLAINIISVMAYTLQNVKNTASWVSPSSPPPPPSSSSAAAFTDTATVGQIFSSSMGVLDELEQQLSQSSPQPPPSYLPILQTPQEQFEAGGYQVVTLEQLQQMGVQMVDPSQQQQQQHYTSTPMMEPLPRDPHWTFGHKPEVFCSPAVQRSHMKPDHKDPSSAYFIPLPSTRDPNDMSPDVKEHVLSVSRRYAALRQAQKRQTKKATDTNDCMYYPTTHNAFATYGNGPNVHRHDLANAYRYHEPMYMPPPNNTYDNVTINKPERISKFWRCHPELKTKFNMIVDYWNEQNKDMDALRCMYEAAGISTDPNANVFIPFGATPPTITNVDKNPDLTTQKWIHLFKLSLEYMGHHPQEIIWWARTNPIDDMLTEMFFRRFILIYNAYKKTVVRMAMGDLYRNVAHCVRQTASMPCEQLKEQISRGVHNMTRLNVASLLTMAREPVLPPQPILYNTMVAKDLTPAQLKEFDDRGVGIPYHMPDKFLTSVVKKGDYINLFMTIPTTVDSFKDMQSMGFLRTDSIKVGGTSESDHYKLTNILYQRNTTRQTKSKAHNSNIYATAAETQLVNELIRDTTAHTRASGLDQNDSNNYGLRVNPLINDIVVPIPGQPIPKGYQEGAVNTVGLHPASDYMAYYSVVGHVGQDEEFEQLTVDDPHYNAMLTSTINSFQPAAAAGSSQSYRPRKQQHSASFTAYPATSATHSTSSTVAPPQPLARPKRSAVKANVSYAERDSDDDTMKKKKRKRKTTDEDDDEEGGYNYRTIPPPHSPVEPSRRVKSAPPPSSSSSSSSDSSDEEFKYSSRDELDDDEDDSRKRRGRNKSRSRSRPRRR